MIIYKQLKTKLLRDKETCQAYDELEAEFEVAEMVIQKRIKKGFTQKEN